MSIHFSETDGIFTLHTNRTTYQMQVDRYGFLLHLYYGARVENQNMNYLVLPVDRGFSGAPHDAGPDRTYSLDTLPLEYPTVGTGDFRISALDAVNPDGSRAVDLRYKSHRVLEGKYSLEGMPALYQTAPSEAYTLEITLKDDLTGVEATLMYGLFPACDILTRAVVIHNHGEGRLQLRRVFSAGLDIPYGDWDWIHFHGRHNMEREFERSAVGHGIQSIGSRRGTSSHHHNPLVILCEKSATEWSGSCYGMNLVYSGNFLVELEKDQTNLVRLGMGLGGDGFCWNLEPGARFAAPEVVMSFSDSGLSALSHNYHAIYRNNLCRGKYKLSRRPVVVNNWEATYFDFNREKLLAIAREAAPLGIEMLVMDDGWFGSRNNDNTSLGDWFVNEAKLPGGLKPLVDEVNALGLQFGIWVEPEMISEESALYRAHPEWVLQAPGRSPVRSRMQLVLDMSRADVRRYLFDTLCGLLDSAHIAYVKWDMNRSVSDWYSNALPADSQGELPHRYVLGLYELLDKLTSRYPDVLFEGCCGGGGRFDPAMLYYHPQIWCSDNTDAVERLKIQYGTSFAYPVCAASSHVSAVPNHQTGRVTPLDTRGVVAMSGSFGYELDLSLLSEEEKQTVKEQTETYKRLQDIIHNGLYYRLTSPYTCAHTAWMFVSKDQNSALLNVVTARTAANPPHIHVLLRGLDSGAVYRVDGTPITGQALMSAGLALKAPVVDYPAVQILIERA